MRLAASSGGLSGRLLDFSASVDYPTTGFTNGMTSPFTPGGMLEAAPTDGVDTTANIANWSYSELVYVFSTGAAAILPGTVCVIDKNFVITAVASTANLGQPLFVALTHFAIGSTTRQAGWVMRSGVCPIRTSVAMTADVAVFIGTAGVVTPTAAAGKQILGCRSLIAGASAFTRMGTTRTSSRYLRMTRVTGNYVGQAVSGTGIAGGSTIASIDPSGMGVTLSADMTASADVTVTFTNTGFGICHIDRPFAQGQIT